MSQNYYCDIHSRTHRHDWMSFLFNSTFHELISPHFHHQHWPDKPGLHSVDTHTYTHTLWEIIQQSSGREINHQIWDIFFRWMDLKVFQHLYTNYTVHYASLHVCRYLPEKVINPRYPHTASKRWRRDRQRQQQHWFLWCWIWTVLQRTHGVLATNGVHKTCPYLPLRPSIEWERYITNYGT